MRVSARLTLRIVRDPIHDYVPYSWVEERVIDSPLFQRLRYVSQNAMAHQTYPSNRTARFTHSLGTMHLGGRFFEAIIRNSEPAAVEDFSKSLGRLIDQTCELHGLDFRKVVAHLQRNPDGFYRQLGFDLWMPTGGSPDPRIAQRICALQAIRLACALHDIGHPIFSHTGEAVLEAQLAVPVIAGGERLDFHEALSETRKSEGRAPLHEALGFRLMDHILKTAIPEGNGFVFAQVCLHLARGIVRERMAGIEDPDGVLPALHSLISGPVDADRADYVQRDGYASAFEFGRFDLQRILLSLRLVCGEDGTFLVRPSSTALSAVESFFVERFRIYRWLVFHHSVMRGQLAIQRALYTLFEIYFSAPSDRAARAIRGILDGRGFTRFWTPFAAGGDLDAYKACDESWAMTLFREILDEPALRSRSVPVRVAVLRSCLRLVVERQKAELKPMWKRLDQYQAFAREVQLTARGSPREFISTLGERLEKLLDDDKEPVAFLNDVFARQFPLTLSEDVPFEGGEVALFERFEDAIAAAWPEAPGRVLFSYKADMTAGPTTDYRLVDVATGRASLDLAKLSAQVRGLPALWAEDTQAWAFLMPGRLSDEGFETEEIEVTDRHRREFAEATAKVLLVPSWRAGLSVSAPSIRQAGGVS